MPGRIPVCRDRVGCARIEKAILEHGAFQYAGGGGVSGRAAFWNGFRRFATRGRSGTAFGVSGWLASRNGFWRFGTRGVLERLSAFRDGWRSGTAFGVSGRVAFWHGFWRFGYREGWRSFRKVLG